MSQTTPPEANAAGLPSRLAGAPRWVKLALVASLAANILVIGVVAGSYWRVRHAGAQAGTFGASMVGYTTTLSGERRAQVRRAFAERRETIRPLRAEVRAAHRALEAQLLAEPFDKARFAEAHEALIAAETKMRLAAGQVIAEMAAEMTPGERRDFVKWRSKHRGPGPRGQDDGDERPGGQRRR